jgi:putative spermidine/putrescine transport system substrate-binding protein
MTKTRHATRAGLAALAMALATSVAMADTVVLTAYSGIFQENYVKAVVEPFMKANPDITIEFYGMPNSAQMLGTLRAQASAPQIDIAIMDVSVAKAATDEGIFAPMDESVTKHLADLYPAGQGRRGECRRRHLRQSHPALQHRQGEDGADLVECAVGRAIYQAGLHSPPCRISRARPSPFSPTRWRAAPTTWKASRPASTGWRSSPPLVQTWEPRPDVYQPISSGTAAIGIGWNARAQVYADLSDGKLGVVLPEEGSGFQINVIGLVKGGPASDSAKKFIDYALSPEAQAAFTEQMFYAPTNSKAAALISEKALSRTAAGAMDKMIDINWLEVAKIRDAITEQWRRRVIPLSR